MVARHRRVRQTTGRGGQLVRPGLDPVGDASQPVVVESSRVPQAETGITGVIMAARKRPGGVISVLLRFRTVS